MSGSTTSGTLFDRSVRWLGLGAHRFECVPHQLYLNRKVDFEVFGAIQTAMSGIAGTNNSVVVALRGVSTQIDVVAVDSVPADPSGSNTVTVLRSPDAR